jgi:hypothetical protein
MTIPLSEAPRVSAETQREWDGMDLVEAGYGWRDLDALTADMPGPPPAGALLQ